MLDEELDVDKILYEASYGQWDRNVKSTFHGSPVEILSTSSMNESTHGGKKGIKRHPS